MFFIDQQDIPNLKSGPLQWASVATCSNSKSIYLATFVYPCQLKQGSLEFLGRLKNWNGRDRSRKFKTPLDKVSAVSVQRVQWVNRQLEGNKIVQPADNGASWQGASFQHLQRGLVSRMLNCGLAHSVDKLTQVSTKSVCSTAVCLFDIGLSLAFLMNTESSDQDMGLGDHTSIGIPEAFASELVLADVQLSDGIW